jgi:hypothetical protein
LLSVLAVDLTVHETSGEDEHQLCRGEMIRRGVLETLAEKGDEIDERVVMSRRQEEQSLQHQQTVESGAQHDRPRTCRSESAIRVDACAQRKCGDMVDLFAEGGEIRAIGVLIDESGRKNLAGNRTTENINRTADPPSAARTPLSTLRRHKQSGMCPPTGRTGSARLLRK